MRILVLSQYYWPETFRITEVAQALRDEGCEVLILTGQPNYPEGVSFSGYSWCSIGSEQHDGMTILRVPLIPRGDGSACRLILNYLSFVLCVSFFGPWLLRGRSIDSIFVFGCSPILQVIPAIWLAKLKKASLITWIQDLWPESLSATGFVHSPKLLHSISHLVSWIYRKNSLLLVQSQAFIKPVQKMAGNIPVRYHPNPGDITFSTLDQTEACPVTFSPGFNVVFAGNLGTVQALETILDAAEILRCEKEIALILVGSGSRSAWMQAEINRRNLANVHLPGRFPPSDMPSIMSRASVLMVSLVKNAGMSQILPSKLQTYMAAGKPIIASVEGEAARIILEAGAGIVTPVEDAFGLADGIRQLKHSPSCVLESMGQNARTYYENNFEPRFLARILKEILMTTTTGKDI